MITGFIFKQKHNTLRCYVQNSRTATTGQPELISWKKSYGHGTWLEPLVEGHVLCRWRQTTGTRASRTTAMETRTVCCSTGTLIGGGMTRHVTNNALAISVKLTCNSLFNPRQQWTYQSKQGVSGRPSEFCFAYIFCYLCIYLLQLLTIRPVYYTGWAKKVSQRSLHITSSNTVLFSKFFHCHILEICNKDVIKYPTSPQTRCHTTLWNTYVSKLVRPQSYSEMCHTISFHKIEI